MALPSRLARMYRSQVPDLHDSPFLHAVGFPWWVSELAVGGLVIDYFFSQRLLLSPSTFLPTPQPDSSVRPRATSTSHLTQYLSE